MRFHESILRIHLGCFSYLFVVGSQFFHVFSYMIYHDFGNLFGRQRSKSVKELQPGLWAPNVVGHCCLLWA